MELNQLIQKIREDGLLDAVLSNPVSGSELEKVKIRPVKIKEEMLWQITVYRNHQVFHENCNISDTLETLKEYIGNPFRQAQIETKQFRNTVLIGKKGTTTIKQKRKEAALETPEVKSHNREKNYIIREGEPVDFLVELGVMSRDGKVLKNKYDKFRQINRFLEFIEDVLPALPKERVLRVIDFGCGKSYLTFAMYYYLHVLKGMELEVTGLDLKKDVIAHCGKLAEKLGYQGLHFEMGDIAGYKDAKGADMVVTLHACDTATDYALAQAIEWGARVILSVPCCQHEVNRQIKCEPLESVLKYGIIKERMSALLTDALRAEMLKEQGYETQILEFIDMEHTPKNLLIRAVRREGIRPAKRNKKSEQTAEFLQVHTTLQKLLANMEENLLLPEQEDFSSEKTGGMK